MKDNLFAFASFRKISSESENEDDDSSEEKVSRSPGYYEEQENIKNRFVSFEDFMMLFSAFS